VQRGVCTATRAPGCAGEDASASSFVRHRQPLVRPVTARARLRRPTRTRRAGATPAPMRATARLRAWLAGRSGHRARRVLAVGRGKCAQGRIQHNAGLCEARAVANRVRLVRAPLRLRLRALRVRTTSVMSGAPADCTRTACFAPCARKASQRGHVLAHVAAWVQSGFAQETKRQRPPPTPRAAAARQKELAASLRPAPIRPRKRGLPERATRALRAAKAKTICACRRCARGAKCASRKNCRTTGRAAFVSSLQPLNASRESAFVYDERASGRLEGGLNVYEFVGGAPTMYIDPLGEDWRSVVRAIGVAIGIASTPGVGPDNPNNPPSPSPTQPSPPPSGPWEPGKIPGNQLPDPSKSPTKVPELPRPSPTLPTPPRPVPIPPSVVPGYFRPPVPFILCPACRYLMPQDPYSCLSV
jgi:hypothetical protein